MLMLEFDNVPRNKLNIFINNNTPSAHMTKKPGVDIKVI